MSINGGNQTPFVTGPADDEDGDYSPNGRRIVFTSDRDTDGDAEVFVMNANGANQTQRTFNAVLDDRPVFSPSNTRIAYSQDSPAPFEDVFVMTAGVGQTRPTSPTWVASMTSHPTGSRGHAAAASGRD